MGEHNSLKPLPLETKCGPLMSPNKNMDTKDFGSTSFIAKDKDLSVDSFSLMSNEMQENIFLVSFSSRLAS